MIPLTGALGDKLGKDKLRELEPDIVVPYLQKNLHWRVQKVTAFCLSKRSRLIGIFSMTGLL
jgi:hypothetical protein